MDKPLTAIQKRARQPSRLTRFALSELQQQLPLVFPLDPALSVPSDSEVAAGSGVLFSRSVKRKVRKWWAIAFFLRRIVKGVWCPVKKGPE